MSELVLLIFKLSFLVALWVFVFFVVAAVRRDLFGERVRKLATTSTKSARDVGDVFGGAPRLDAPANLPSQPSLSGDSSSDAPRAGCSLELVIVSGKHAGDRLALTTEPVSIGRSSDSTIVIRDDYTSNHHARLEYRSGSWVLTDLDSTNGTFLAGKRIDTPSLLEIDQSFTIGATTFAMRLA